MTMTATPFSSPPNGATAAVAVDDGDLIVEPTPGDDGAGVESTDDDNATVGPDGTEATEFTEASPEALASPADDHTIFEDLRKFEGFEEPTGQETAGLPAAQLADAGALLAGGQEFSFLGPLVASTVPWLASRLGPAIARPVYNRLSDRVKRMLGRAPRGNGTTAQVIRLFNDPRNRTVESVIEAVDDTLVEQMAQAIEAIIGADDRFQITDTRGAPWPMIAACLVTFENGTRCRGTAWAAGPQAWVTAGHVVHQKGKGWAKQVEVIPGCNGSQRPFGSAVSVGVRSTVGWVQSQQSERDYGVVFVPPGAFGGRQLGTFGFGALSDEQLLGTPISIAGYPGDKPFAEMWAAGRRITTVTPTQIQSQTDTTPGQSGAPVVTMINGQRLVIGIHNYGASTANTATRVTRAVQRNLVRWSRIGQPGTSATI